MRIGRLEIAAMIPHGGEMCLLDEVIAWDTASIRCASESHRSAVNPLARDGVLPVLCGLEYAAQAMAIHGRLTDAVSERPRAGYLASIRDVKWAVARLDNLAGTLMIEAEKLAGDGAGVLYRFALTSRGDAVLSGRAAVLLDAGKT